MHNYQKIGIGTALFLTWLWLVATGRTDTQTFVQAIQAALVGLGMYHIGGSGK